MSYKLIAVIMIFCLAVTGCEISGADADKQSVETTTRIVINAYNSGNFDEAYKHLSPTYSEFKLNGKEVFSVADIVPPVKAAASVDSLPPPSAKYNIRLESYNIRVYGDSAVLTGYINGSIIEPTNDKYEGPWRTSIFFIKKDNEWMLESLHMSLLKAGKLNYLVQLLKSYDQKEMKKWPLLIFLHGMESRGDNLEMVKARVLPKLAETNKDFPFILVSPQCPADSVWDDHIVELNNMLDEVIEKYAVDIDRVYLTGMSMGGHGTWVLAMSYPNRFAAIAPVCGWADPTRVGSIKKIPVWAFHGDKDDLVPIDYEQKAVDALKKIGGDVKFTIYKGVDHNSWDPAYNNEVLYLWLLQHTKKTN